MRDEKPWSSFWVGFLVAGVVAALMYRQWRALQAPAAERPLSLHGYEPPAPERTSGGVSVAVKERDDLTAIKGIGPVYSQKLNEGGIYSYADLAGLTPAAVSTLLGLSGRESQVASWISQAQALAVAWGG